MIEIPATQQHGNDEHEPDVVHFSPSSLEDGIVSYFFIYCKFCCIFLHKVLERLEKILYGHICVIVIEKMYLARYNRRMLKHTRILLALCVIGVATTLFLVRDQGGAPSEPTHTYSTQTIQEYGFSFTYKSSATGGYTLTEPPLGQEGDGLIKIITFEENVSLPNSSAPTPSETPPQMSILVLQNIEQTDIRTWAQKNIIYSGFDRIVGEVKEQSLGNTKAISYITDGLYATETVVFASNGFIVIFLGPYIDKQSDLYKDFKMLIDSIQVL